MLTDDLCSALERYIFEKLIDDFDLKSIDELAKPDLHRIIIEGVQTDSTSLVQYLINNLEDDILLNDLKKVIVNEKDFIKRDEFLMKIERIIVKLELDNYIKRNIKPSWITR